MAKFDIKEFARRGAEARASELQAELKSIYAAFPDLRRRGATAGPAAGGRRRRKPMNAAQKRAVSIRMKKYWAERRKEKSK